MRPVALGPAETEGMLPFQRQNAPCGELADLVCAPWRGFQCLGLVLIEIVAIEMDAPVTSKQFTSLARAVSRTAPSSYTIIQYSHKKSRVYAKFY